MFIILYMLIYILIKVDERVRFLKKRKKIVDFYVNHARNCHAVNLWQEQEKSRLLEESMKKLDAEMQRTDALLYQMIPKPVADRLRRGEPSVSTCEVCELTSISRPNNA